MKSFFLEGYGCSLNISETEKIESFLIKNNFKKESDFTKADFVIINTCSVKQVTEQRMLSRIKLFLEKKKENALVLVFGCLASAQHKSVEELGKGVIVLDNSLESLCRALKIKEHSFSPEIVPKNSHDFIAIIGASTGCLGSCTYCSARLARKELHSYSVKSIVKAVKSALKGDEFNKPAKEIWLTSQDLGCYGFDISSSLPELLAEILKVKGNFKLRLGMMNPNHFLKIQKELLPLFADNRIYKFLHLPLQSGSDRVLKLMNRKYSSKEFLKCVSDVKKMCPQMNIATDVIAGFPGETDGDFKKTLAVMKKASPDVVNISRFAKRKGTLAEKMPLQLSDAVKKERSKAAMDLCNKIFAENNSKTVGSTVPVLVLEKTKNGFNARTDSYKTVFIKSGYGKFINAKILSLNGHYFIGEEVK